VLCTSIVLFSFLTCAFAQVSDKIVKIIAASPRQGEPLSIQLELANAGSLDRVEIAYRPFGQHDFKSAEMVLTGNTASITIPAANLVSPFFEYFITLYSRGTMTLETYPLDNPQEHPLRVDIQQSVQEEQHGIVVLSPEENERLNAEDVFLSFIIRQEDSTLDIPNTKVFLDGVDISTSAVLSGNLFVVQPEHSSFASTPGSHTVRVEAWTKEGKPAFVYNWNFTVRGGVSSTDRFGSSTNGWLYNSSIQLETRNENIANNTTPYNRATVSASGMYDRFRIVGRLYATNDEEERRQPQNRYFIGAESPWLSAGYGDSYPLFPEYIMNGKHLRGFAGKLTLGAFNLDIAKGDIIRRIESNIVKVFPESSLTNEQQQNPSGSFARIDSTTWAQIGSYGTFNRDLFVIRPSFGKENARIGFSYLKSSDDPASIRFGIKPQENLALGSDLVLALDNRNVEITGQAGISATNKDISHGTFADSTIDSLYKDYSEQSRNSIRKARDFFSRFITVNENLVPLTMKNLPTLSYEGAIGLNYFNNTIKFSYLRHGNNFESFGQSFFRQDIVGYNISDRLRLVGNTLFLSGGFERMQDNTANTKPATTTSTTANVGVSYYPKSSLPSITIAYLLASNTNDLQLNSLYATDDQSNRVLVQLGREFSFAGGRHQTTLGVSTSIRDDKTSKNLDSRNTSVSLGARSMYSIPLQTSVNVTVNTNAYSSIDSTSTISISRNYTTLYTNAQYALMNNRLLLGGTVSPTFGDIQRTLVDASAQYFITKSVSAQGLMSLYFNTGGTNDLIWSIILRLDI
jgi:hypothetical protein